MERKDKIGTFGAVSLVLFSTLLAFNHVVIKVVNSGLQPVFSAGVRSVGASIILFLAFRFLGRRMKVPEGSWPGILLISVFFSVEFIFLFVALDLTTVGRTSVIFYSMPVWMAIGAHFWLGEKLTSIKVVGLVLAMLGVAWAILDRCEFLTQPEMCTNRHPNRHGIENHAGSSDRRQIQRDEQEDELNRKENRDQ